MFKNKIFKHKLFLPKWATSFGNQVVFGLFIGLILGIISLNLGENNIVGNTSHELGIVYVQLLKLMVPLLVFTAVVTSIGNLKKVSNAASLAVQSLIWFAITAFASVITALFIASIIKPGKHFVISDNIDEGMPSTVGSWWSFLKGIVPDNFLGLQIKISSNSDSVNETADFQVLQILAISLIMGIAALKVGKKSEPFFDIIKSLLAIVQKILWWVIRLAPIGTAALIANAISAYGWKTLGSLGFFAITIYLSLAVVILIIYPISLLSSNINPIKFFKKVWPVTTLGFVTRSSLGVMPVNQEIAEKKMGVPREYASFIMPLAATTKMDGCASVYPAVSSIFIAEFYHIPLEFKHYILIILVSVLGSAATAGTTGATVMLTLTLSTLGLPLEGVGLLLSIEPIIDMGRTAINVTGQSVVATIVAKRNNILNMQIWENEDELVGVVNTKVNKDEIDSECLITEKNLPTKKN